MKKKILKMKVFLTNISRVVMSVLFMNLNFSYSNKVFGFSIGEMLGSSSITCYDTVAVNEIEPTNAITTKIETANTLVLKDVLIILIPLAIIVGIIILIVKKKKGKSKEEKIDDKQD